MFRKLHDPGVDGVTIYIDGEAIAEHRRLVITDGKLDPYAGVIGDWPEVFDHVARDRHEGDGRRLRRRRHRRRLERLRRRPRGRTLGRLAERGKGDDRRERGGEQAESHAVGGLKDDGSPAAASPEGSIEI